jgi:hypothetical protein
VAGKSKQELEVLATFVHGVLFAFHALGVVYNVRQGNKVDATVPAIAGAYDLASTLKHYRQHQVAASRNQPVYPARDFAEPELYK